MRSESRTRACYFVLENVEIGHVQQEIVQEQIEERNGPVEYATAETTENSASTKPKPLPGKPIPIFAVNAFSVWKKPFFRD